MQDTGLEDHHDLRGGCPPWNTAYRKPVRRRLDRSFRCQTLVVGAGITGALMAEHLARMGRQVCIVDKERAGFGSTAASTAMLQWEIDCSLSELTNFYGFERAAQIYRRSLQAVTGLKALVVDLGLNCAYRDRSSIYVAGADTPESELREEHGLRRRAELPGEFADYLSLRREFGFDRASAIISPGSAEADPLLLAHALLNSAISRGAALFDAEAISYSSFGHGVIVQLDGGLEIEAEHVVLATGYVLPDFITTELHKTASSWAIATSPQEPGRLWRDGALVWEASEPYLYARTMLDNRIIIGGEDDDAVTDPDERDSQMDAKAAILSKKLAALWPQAEVSIDLKWSGAFGETEDGLPLVGEVPGHPHILAAYGYGGNGITFSYMASRIVERIVSGARQPWFDEFALDRPRPPHA